MQQQIIKCAFCKGKGNNPHFRGTCPVCKGEGRNQITGKYMACGDCRGSGQKRGTTLTCYTCSGLGVVSDTRKEFKEARQEIRKAQEEMEEERIQLTRRKGVCRGPIYRGPRGGVGRTRGETPAPPLGRDKSGPYAPQGWDAINRGRDKSGPYEEREIYGH